jgi:hypothetical protein
MENIALIKGRIVTKNKSWQGVVVLYKEAAVVLENQNTDF